MSQRKRLSNTPGSSQGKRPSSSSVAQEEHDDTAFTQPSTSQVQRGMEKLTPAQVDQKTAEVVQYFLVKDQKKIPVRRAELVKHVVKEYRTIYPEIMKRAARTFDQVFGLKMIEIDAKNHMYILINKLEPAEGPPATRSPTNPKMGLLFVILSVVFMKGGVVRESTWSTCASPTRSRWSTSSDGVNVPMWKCRRPKSWSSWVNSMNRTLRPGPSSTERPTPRPAHRRPAAARDDADVLPHLPVQCLATPPPSSSCVQCLATPPSRSCVQCLATPPSSSCVHSERIKPYSTYFTYLFILSLFIKNIQITQLFRFLFYCISCSPIITK
ncbi:necdin-like 2 isoform X2 [Cyclopterus lumpus]|uniref:necdin-like 2 isoform X2 n=1 Tax=Cyclopterus lumpus TaxID=8103 RepID=UPI001486F6C3|nr:necdin-like 2 isoform X2 [Cyclopterus lumpus]